MKLQEILQSFASGTCTPGSSMGLAFVRLVWKPSLARNLTAESLTARSKAHKCQFCCKFRARSCSLHHAWTSATACMIFRQ